MDSRISERSRRYGPPLERGDAEYNRLLRKVGDYILERTERLVEQGKQPQKLSRSVLAAVAGRLNGRFAITYEARKILHADLLKLDAKYGLIELQHRPDFISATNVRLRTFEDGESEEKWLREALSQYDTEKKLPRHATDEIMTAHNKMLEAYDCEPRTKASFDYQIANILGRRFKHDMRGSPDAANPLEVLLEDLPNNDLEEIVEEDENGERKKAYLDIPATGHQKLLAFLMDPDNYKVHIGPSLELVTVDFTTDNTPQDLYDLFSDRLTMLDLRPDEEELTSFVDHWLQCDMIFRRPDGGYLIVEVKQNALDTEIFANATKARQQLAAYKGTMHSNVVMRNLRGNHKPVPEHVDGVLACYTIDDELAIGLGALGMRSVTIAKEVVDQYIRDKKLEFAPPPPPPERAKAVVDAQPVDIIPTHRGPGLRELEWDPDRGQACINGHIIHVKGGDEVAKERARRQALSQRRRSTFHL
tara:strand:- start:2151 stop:3575 length:1425 start_codon:yes stop_codon:yes gene_type:complete